MTPTEILTQMCVAFVLVIIFAILWATFRAARVKR